MDYVTRGSSQSVMMEWVALSRERDPELRAESLLVLAGREERRSRPDSAASIYRALTESSDTPASSRERARRRLEALRGSGEIRDRAEVLLSRFVSEVSEPSSLLALTVAGAAFRATRLLTLSRLTASPIANFLTRGVGARSLAGLNAFAMEATFFPLAGRLGSLALGRELDWSGPALGRELASSFLMLGALRAGGALTSALMARNNLIRPVAQQAGMFGGILFGHELEVRAGLRERTSSANTLLDSLSTLLQFNVAARLSRSLMGEGFRRWERTVELQSDALSQPFSNSPLSFPIPELALAGQNSRPRSAPIDLDRLYMSGQDGKPPSGSKGGRLISMEEFLERKGRRGRTPPAPTSKEPSGPKPRLREEFVNAVSAELWIPEIRNAMMLWLAETPIHPDMEFPTLRNRLLARGPEFTSLFGFLAMRRPMAAKLLALRLDLVRENSWLRLAPDVQEAAREAAMHRFGGQELSEMFQNGLQRYLEMCFRTGLSDLSDLNVGAHQLAFETSPAELAEAWRDPLLSDAQFLLLSRALGIFPEY